MKDKGKFFKWLKRPHGVFLSVVYILTAGAVAGSVALAITGVNGGAAEIISYVLYAVAALFLGYSIYTIILYIPVLKRKAGEKLRSKKFTAGILEDYDFKTTVFAAVSFAVTVAFATMNLVSAVKYRLLWYGAFAAYYFLLILFRGGVIFSSIRYKKKYGISGGFELFNWRVYLAGGMFLMLLEIAMAGAVTQMMLSPRPVVSGQIMAITNAAYTFFKVITSTLNLVKAKKSGNPTAQALRNVNFADACMSIVSLTVLMVATFDAENSADMTYVKAGVGFFACAAIIIMAILMIVRAAKKIKALKAPEGENCYERQ